MRQTVVHYKITMPKCETNTEVSGKTVIITGGSSGVGLETAKLLAGHGARVVIASRNETKLQSAVRDIKTATGNDNVAYRRLDLGSLQSVRTFVTETISAEDRVDVLINNAGAVGLPDRLTEDGLNYMMQVNYFGLFLLTYLLLPKMRTAEPSRIINVSAATMYIGEIDFDHLNDVGYWSGISLLANAKLANSLFTVELANRLLETNVTANSFDPFLVSDTAILDNLPETLNSIGKLFVQIIGRSKVDVANEVVYLAAEEMLEGVTGRHFKFCQEWYNTWLASDKDLRTRLWKVSKELVKITPNEDWDSDTAK